MTEFEKLCEGQRKIILKGPKSIGSASDASPETVAEVKKLIEEYGISE